MIMRVHIIGDDGEEVSVETPLSYAGVRTDQGFFPNDDAIASVSESLQVAFGRGECDLCERSFLDVPRDRSNLHRCSECASYRPSQRLTAIA